MGGCFPSTQPTSAWLALGARFKSSKHKPNTWVEKWKLHFKAPSRSFTPVAFPAWHLMSYNVKCEAGCCGLRKTATQGELGPLADCIWPTSWRVPMPGLNWRGWKAKANSLLASLDYSGTDWPHQTKSLNLLSLYLDPVTFWALWKSFNWLWQVVLFNTASEHSVNAFHLLARNQNTALSFTFVDSWQLACAALLWNSKANIGKGTHKSFKKPWLDLPQANDKHLCLLKQLGGGFLPSQPKKKGIQFI